MSLPSSLASRLRLPLIAAPMLRVSGPDLVAAACRSGVIGAFPTVNARGAEQLDAWLAQIKARCAEAPGPVAPVCPNIIMRRQATLDEDLRVLVRHRVEMVIASVGSPEVVIQPLHDIGCLVFADVASIRHAEKALAAGADGLILLTAGGSYALQAGSRTPSLKGSQGRREMRLATILSSALSLSMLAANAGASS